MKKMALVFIVVVVADAVFHAPSADSDLESVVWNKLAGSKWLSCQWAVGISLVEPLKNGFAIIAQAVAVHDRIPHQFQADGADESIRDLSARRLNIRHDGFLFLIFVCCGVNFMNFKPMRGVLENFLSKRFVEFLLSSWYFF